jgi:hypothetical protein
LTEGLPSKPELLGPLSSSLRSLLHWNKDNDPNFDPLLLRMANVDNLPLPVYAFEYAQPPMINSECLQVHSNGPSLIREFGTESLMDLQAWMETTIVAIGNFGAPASTGGISKSNRAMLAEVAHTCGAHFDPDKSDVVEIMRQAGMANAGLLYQYFWKVGGVVCELGDWVLAHLKGRKLL